METYYTRFNNLYLYLTFNSVFGFLPVGNDLRILRWLMFRLLQEFCDFKDNLIHIWCMNVWPLYMNVSHTPMHCMCSFGKKRDFYPLIPTSRIIFQVYL